MPNGSSHSPNVFKRAVGAAGPIPVLGSRRDSVLHSLMRETLVNQSDAGIHLFVSLYDVVHI